MNWSGVAEFLAMGGYGLYVWGSFGVTAAALVGEMLSLRARRRALRSRDVPVREPIDYRGSSHEA